MVLNLDGFILGSESAKKLENVVILLVKRNVCALEDFKLGYRSSVKKNEI